MFSNLSRDMLNHELPSLSPLLIEIKLSIRWIGKILKPKIILSFFGFFNQNEIVILAFFLKTKLTKKVCFLGNSAF